MIYYFSGTGNSQWVAEQLAILTHDEAINLAPMIENKLCTTAISVGKGERVGLVFPIYAWGAPKIVDEFVAALTVDPAAYAYAVCTCGDDAGLSMRALRKRYPWKAAWSVAMPNNYIPMYDVDEPALAASKIANARKRLPAIAEKINARAAITDVRHGGFSWVKTTLVNPLFKNFATDTKSFTADASCTGCGLCEKNCPRHAIRLTDGKPVWVKRRCLMCMACIQRCPAKAIQYGEATRKRGRYYFKGE